MTENEIAKEVVDICYRIHKQYGPGLFESVYEEIICYELSKQGIAFRRQFPFRISHDAYDMGIGFRADVVVDDKVILEIKSVEDLHEVYFKQIITYLKLNRLKLGLLVNFKVPLIKYGINRIVNNL